MKVKVYNLTDNGKVLINETIYTKKQLQDLKSNPKIYLTKSTLKILEQVNPTKKIVNKLSVLNINNLLCINSTYYNIDTPLKNYLGAYSDLFKSIKIFESNPILKHKKRIEKVLKEIEKEKVQFENNYFYKEFERENNLKDKELQQLRLELKTVLNTLEIKAKYVIKQPTEPKKPLSLKPNFDDFNGQINTIYTETKTLFTSTLSQWEQLFSDDIQIFKSPIELNQKTTLSDLRLLLDKLSQKGLIKNSKFNKLLQTVKAFSYNGLIITANQYKDAKQTQNYPSTLNSNTIQDVFNALNVD